MDRASNVVSRSASLMSSVDPQHTPLKTEAGGCAMSIYVRDGRIISVSFTQVGYTLAYINKIWSAQIFSWHFVFATTFSGLRGIE